MIQPCGWQGYCIWLSQECAVEGTGKGPLALTGEDIDALFGASPAALSR